MRSEGMKYRDMSHVEIDVVSWCVGHGAVWLEGSTVCEDGSVEETCVEAPLFHGPPLAPAGPDYRIALRPDDHTADPMESHTILDDIVVKDVAMFRAEDMGDWWWVCCYLGADLEDRIAWHIDKDGHWRTTEFPQQPVAYEHEAKP